jgi:hypothetical protein
MTYETPIVKPSGFSDSKVADMKLAGWGRREIRDCESVMRR